MPDEDNNFGGSWGFLGGEMHPSPSRFQAVGLTGRPTIRVVSHL